MGSDACEALGDAAECAQALGRERVLDLVEARAERPVVQRVADARDDAGKDGRVFPAIERDLAAGHLLELLLQARVVGVAQESRGDDLRAQQPLLLVVHLAKELGDPRERAHAAAVVQELQRVLRRLPEADLRRQVGDDVLLHLVGEERVLERRSQLGARLVRGGDRAHLIDQRVELPVSDPSSRSACAYLRATTPAIITHLPRRVALRACRCGRLATSSAR